MLLLLLAVLSCVAIGTTWVSSGSAPTNDEGSEFLSGWTGSLLLATVALSTLSDVNGTIIVSASLWKHRREKLSSCVFTLSPPRLLFFCVHSFALTLSSS